MAFNRAQVESVVDGLSRCLTIQAKLQAVSQASKIIVNESEDLNITTPAQVTAYLALLAQRRDAIIAQVQPVVAAWTP